MQSLFEDQVRMLDELIVRFEGHFVGTDDELAQGAADWAARVPARIDSAAHLTRAVRLLSLMLPSGHADARRLARSGLAYLLGSAGPQPEEIAEIAAFAHSFVLSEVLHRARVATGAEAEIRPASLSTDDRLRAEGMLRAFKDVPLTDDATLIQRTAALYDKPDEVAGTVFFRQVLRLASFLVTVLDGEGFDAGARSWARGALSYLVTPDDAIDDRLGLVGYVDDAWVLETAVDAIEPARRTWMRVVEASQAWSAIARRLSLRAGTASTEVRHDTITNAALLAEPFARDGVLATALLVPTAGSTTVLLGLAVGLLAQIPGASLHRPFTVEDLQAWGERGDGPPLLLVAPPARVREVVEGLYLGADRVLPIGDQPALAKIGFAAWYGREAAEPWSDGAATHVLVVPDLDVAARAVRAFGCTLILVDLAVATLSDLDDDPPTETRAATAPSGRARRASRRRLFDGYDLLGGARDVPLLTAAQEVELSHELRRSRIARWRAAVRLGPKVLDAVAPELPPGAARQAIHDARPHLADLLTLEATGDVVEQRLVAVADTLASTPIEDEILDRAVAAVAGPRRRNLSADQVPAHRAFHEAKEHLEAAIRTLTEANLRLVVSIVRRYPPRGVPFFDLVQEGNLGLIRAARKFDHGMGARFATYARWWIRQGVEQSLSQHGRPMRVPGHALTSIRRVDKAAQRLMGDLGREPTNDEIGAAVDLTAEDVARIKQMRHELDAAASLDRPVTEDSETSIRDVLHDPDQKLPFEEVADAQLVREAARLMETLEPNEIRVLQLRFGLADHVPHTLAEIGKVVGLTRERIRQIELKALGKLRFRARKAGVDAP